MNKYFSKFYPKYLNKEIVLLLLFISIIVIIQIISQYRKSNINIKIKKNNIRSSYGNEYYNYYGGDNDTMLEKPADNIQELIVEGFENDIIAIEQTHRLCPVMEGNVTHQIDSIQYPNNNMKGLPGSVEKCFYVSTCCNHCLSQIQESLRKSPDNRVYDIIYKDNYYILTKNGEEKQVVFPCDKDGILELIKEHSGIR